MKFSKVATIIAGFFAMLAVGFVVGCSASGTASPGSDYKISPTQVPLDDGSSVTCLVFDNTGYDGDMITCNWK